MRRDVEQQLDLRQDCRPIRLSVLTVSSKQPAQFHHDTLRGVGLEVSDSRKRGLNVPPLQCFLPLLGLELCPVVTEDDLDRDSPVEIEDTNLEKESITTKM
jgi:hypothetical protein